MKIKKAINIGLLLILIFLINISSQHQLYASSSNKLEICKDCIVELDYLNNLINNNYKNVELKIYEISKDSRNLSLLFYLLDELGYKDAQKNLAVPVIFIEDKTIIGKKQADINLENILIDILSQSNYSNNVSNLIKDYFNENQNETLSGNSFITYPAVIVSALLDSINPCAIAVIVFLISTLLLNLEKKKILMFGLIYIVTIFIAYISIGLGLVYLIKKITIPHLFFIFAGSVLIITGIISIKDFFKFGKGINLSIPQRFKETIKNNIHKATIFSIIIVGLIISIFEAACSGAIYLGVLSLISQSGLNFRLLLLLLLYNFIFILPLFVILLIFYFGLPLKKINRFLIQKNKKIYRLITGLVLILLGVYLIVWL